MTAVPARAPAPRPRPRPGPRPRPHAVPAPPSGRKSNQRTENAKARPLEVVDPSAPPAAARARRPRVGIWIGAVVACVLVLALAAVHSQLVSNQVRLDGLTREVSAEQARYASLRLEVAGLEAPERIVREAQERMGMVAPDTVTYLAPSGAVAAEVAPADGSDPAAEEAGDGERSWAAVKPYLGDR